MSGWRACWADCLCVLVALAAVLPGAVAQATCRVQLAGTGARLTGPTATASAVRSGSVRCTGTSVAFTGPIALRGVVTFAGGLESLKGVPAGQPVTILACSSVPLRGPAWHLLSSPRHCAGATFTADPSAAGLLTFSSGGQVRHQRLSLHNWRVSSLVLTYL